MYSVNVITVLSLCIIVKNCDSSEYVNNSYVRQPRQINYGCHLPPHPSHGKWNVYEATSQFRPGQVVPKKTIIQVSCNDDYKLDGDGTIICLDGKWSSDIGQCLRTCSSRYSSPIMTVTCTYNGRTLDVCEKPLDGTLAKFRCADYYEDKGLERYPTHVCYNGEWNHLLPECLPICGQKSIQHDPTLIVSGKNVTKGEYPWQVALYNVTDKELLCGGSLLNQRVILTAAHCITDTDGNLFSKETYMVAVGKYFRKYDHSGDYHEAQFSAIYDMYVPTQYRGDIQNYFGDIAILVTKKTFSLSSRVQPVCVDWGAHHHQPLIDTKKISYGHVTGWGFTVEYKNPSTVLKELRVPIINTKECVKQLAEDYQRFLTHDKLCAGFLDQGQSICKGDSGGGLVSKYGDRYYIIGVVSLAPQAPTEEGGCDSQQYSLFTSVSYYIESFIIGKEAKFKPGPQGQNLDCEDDPNCRNSASTTVAPTTTTEKPQIPVSTDRPVTPAPNFCTLPEHPLFGKWSLFGTSSTLKPGNKVSLGTVLQISCEKDYTLKGAEIILCENGKWAAEIGQCLRSCPPLRNSDTVQISCSHNDKEMKDCSKAPDGTIAKHQCAPFYEDIQLAKNPVRVCRNGSWDMKKPECVPLCGLKSVTPQTLIVNGDTVKQGEYPWQVGIYGARKQFVCGGALISQRLILTAAHCVTNWKAQLQPITDYSIAVGKFYREYFDPLDFKAQFSGLQDIFIPLEYVGTKNNYLADIAVLVTEKPLVLSQRVQPVCVDWGSNYINESTSQNISAFVSGWGFTLPNSQPSDTLQNLQVPIVTNEECVKALPEDFRSYVTPDTFCAGYLNQNTSVCSGDAGGPLVTKHNGRYFVTGIISTHPSAPTGGCDTNQYTLYKKVSDYNSFILEKEARIRATTSPDSDCRNSEDPKACQPTTPKPTTTPSVQKFSCQLPQHPAFGKYALYGSSSKLKLPGETVPEGTLLEISCFNTYKLDGGTLSLCENGKWSTEIGKCLKTCPAVKNTPQVKATCIVDGKESENCDQPTDGTSVKYECAPFYEDLQLAQNPVHMCQNGKWSHKSPECVPVCGQKHVTAQPLIVNGEPTKKGDYPWHVAIYRGDGKVFTCSGTLISQRIILTAAQCVTEFNSTPRPKAQFTVVAGKYYRNFNDTREDAKDVQSSTLEDIIIHPEYKGVSRMNSGSLAILVTSKPFTLSPRVQPICVDWGLKYDKELTQAENLTAYVTGWGFTAEDDNPSDTLQQLQVPIVSNEKCQKELPEQFSNFLTFDKMCAGYRNEGKSVCKGDSGGPLMVKFNGRFYITGIVDAGPPGASGGCDSQQYAIYTKVSRYTDNFILQSTKQYN